MKRRGIAKSQIALLVSYVIFIALAERPEAFKNEFISHSQLQRESRHLVRTSSSLHSRKLIDGQVGNFSSNWAGAEQTSPPNGSFTTVSAQWIVPNVSLPPGAGSDGSWVSSVWVGIDGDGACQGLLEAGTQSYVVVNSTTGTTSYSAQAFYSWGPGTIFVLDKFPVSPGDTVEVLVNTTSPSSGQVVFTNTTTGAVVSQNVVPPSNITSLCGQTVEWIVEDPGLNNGFYPFANFGNVFFQNCAATTTVGNSVNLTGAEIINMMQGSQGQLATANVINATELQISYD